jgi:hypothetical protein
MTWIDALDWFDLVLAVWLLASTIVFFRPANGARPLLVGFAGSSLFATVLTTARLAVGHDPYRAPFAVLIFLWLGLLLWAIYAVYLGNPRPFRHLVLLGWRRLTSTSR